MQQEYLKLGMAVLKRSCKDLVRFSGARNRREYRSARRFLDSDLFGMICRAAGADPERTRDLILLRTGRERVAEDRRAYRARRQSRCRGPIKEVK